jgi:hypothetical protein
MRGVFSRGFLWIMVLLLGGGWSFPEFASGFQAPVDSEEAAKGKDLAQWRELFQKGEYDALDKIGDELRRSRAKYPDGRGKLWRFIWIGTTFNPNDMKPEEWDRSFERVEAWLKAKPKSVNARLVLPHARDLHGQTPRLDADHERPRRIAERLIEDGPGRHRIGRGSRRDRPQPGHRRFRRPRAV